MGVTRMPFDGRRSARLGPTFRRNDEIPKMVTAVNPGTSTRNKLLLARTAAESLAHFSTLQKNALLLLMADAIEANAKVILEANQIDLERSGLAGSMRDRLLL